MFPHKAQSKWLNWAANCLNSSTQFYSRSVPVFSDSSSLFLVYTNCADFLLFLYGNVEQMECMHHWTGFPMWLADNIISSQNSEVVWLMDNLICQLLWLILRFVKQKPPWFWSRWLNGWVTQWLLHKWMNEWMFFTGDVEQLKEELASLKTECKTLKETNSKLTERLQVLQMTR